MPRRLLGYHVRVRKAGRAKRRGRRARSPRAEDRCRSENHRDELVRRVQNVYRNQEGLIARFRQRTFNKTFGLPSVNDGKIYLKKPGKVRLDYFSRRDSSKVSSSLISNGKMIWAVDINGKWYYQQRLTRSTLPAAITFMTGAGDLARRFNARLLTGSKHGAIGEKVLELAPKEPSSTLKTLVLVVDPSDFRVRKLITTSSADDTNELSFYQPDTTRTVADTWFVFDPEAANARGFRQIKWKGAPPKSP